MNIWRKKLWRIFKYILGVFALLCVILVLWWLNIEGVFLSDLKDTKARIASSAHFINGVAQNFEPNKSSESNADDSQDFRESAENKKKFTKLSLLEISSVEISSVKSDLSELSKNDSFVWFGHSSYMLNLGGKTLLIDPVLKDNAAPLPFVINAFKGADIYAPSELPTIDFLLITHNHYDHLSKSTIRALAPKIKRAIVPLGVGKYLKAWGVSEDKIIELDWDESVKFGALRFYCLRARHYSSRGLLDRDKTLWASFLVEYGADLRTFGESNSKDSRLKNAQDLRESRSKYLRDSQDSRDSRDLQVKKIFIGGDSGYGAHFAEFGKKFGAIDLAFLDNGQFNARWEWVHAFPHQNLKIAKELNAKAIMPLHNSKFRLAPHEWSEPLEQIYTLYLQGKFDFALLTPQIGQIVPLWREYKNGDFSPWWREVTANPK